MITRPARGIATAILGLVVIGCASTRIADDDGIADDGEGDGGIEQPLPETEPDWTASCPTLAELEEVDLGAFGACSNQPLETALTQQNAEDILYRVVHESGHIASLVAGSGGDLFTWTDGGAHFFASTDDGYLVGALPEAWDGESGACAVAEFDCWTGGHGGWGPSALAGVALIDTTLAEGFVTHVRIVSDSLWLVESGPLSGTPPAAVAVDLVLVDGEILELSATIGEYRITR